MSEHPGVYVVPGVPGCPFCSIDASRVAWSSRLIIALWDAFPVSPGHALIVPRSHVAAWHDLSGAEKTAIMSGIDELRLLIDDRYHPDGYNVGFNDGVAAGQTVMHFHMHVIPRYCADVGDPRGGIRWVLRDKAVYWQDTPK